MMGVLQLVGTSVMECPRTEEVNVRGAPGSIHKAELSRPASFDE